LPRSLAQSRNPLPNPRLISIKLSQNRNEVLDHLWTNMMPIFGQFLAHDIAKSESGEITSNSLLLKQKLFFY
jgi:hypothetical protein